MSDKRIDEAIVKLNEVEKRYLNDNKNLDDLRKIWGTNSELFQAHYDDFMKKPGGTIFTFIITSAGYVLIDSTKQEDGFKQLQGLVADGVMTAISFVLKNTPASRAVEVVNWVMSLIDMDVSSLAKKYYDKVLGFDFDKISVTLDGFLQVTMDDGTIYARPFLPNAHGSLFGDTKDDVLFGGNGNDMLIGHGGKDILIGGNGKDDYFVDNGDIIKDSDGNGRVFLENHQLTGGTQIEKGSNIYKGKDGTKYELKNGNLIINDDITIENFSNDKLEFNKFSIK